MDTAPAQEHLKRPRSAANDKNDPYQNNPRRKFRRRATDSLSDFKDNRSEDGSGSSMSESEEHELGPVGSDADIDEESGLTGKERQKPLHKKKRQHALGARIAGAGASANDEQREADRSVLKRILFNTFLILMWYIFSLSISLYNKWMFSGDHLNFHFPLFTTSLHMIIQFLLSCIVLLIFPSLRPASTITPEQEVKSLVTPLFYFTRLIPTGVSTSLDIGLGNTSLRYITLTFYTMCKSSVLIFVLTFAFLFRLEAPSWRLILIILTMTGGVLLMVAGETEFQALGFTLAMSASFFSGFRWALTQILLLRHPATSNPFVTLFFLAPIMFVTLFVIALFAETPPAIITGLHILVSEQGLGRSLVLLIVPGTLAFCMIASEFTLLQRTSVVTLSICGIFKEVVTISAAGIVYHDELSIINVSGLVVTILCIACYNYLKVSKMRADARSKLQKKDDAPKAKVSGQQPEDAQPLMNGHAAREADEGVDSTFGPESEGVQGSSHRPD